MPEKDGSDDKKSTKSVVNKKQKQFMNQEEQLDLSSVAESFGGQIIGEPVELDEFVVSGTLGTAALLKMLAAGGLTAAGIDYYQKMKGKKGIFPSPQDYSNVAQYGKEKAKQVVHEKMDPVGQEDKDIDNDGDHDSTDKYLANRRKAIGKAIAKKRGRVKEGFSAWRIELDFQEQVKK